MTVYSMINSVVDENGVRARSKSSIIEAFQSIQTWYQNGNEYAVDLSSPEALAEFVASHRLACAWAVLLRKGHDQRKERES